MREIPEYQKKHYEALSYACIIHKDQMYDVDKPYMFHLIAVGNVLTRFGFTLSEYWYLHAAALLHDTVEDRQAKIKDIREKFGDEVAIPVYLVSDEKGMERSERHKKTYPEIAKNESAVIVKLGDRIANVEYGISTSDLKHYRKYRKEYKYFRKTLKKEAHLLTIEMWKHLDNLFDWEEE